LASRVRRRAKQSVCCPVVRQSASEERNAQEAQNRVAL